MSTTITAPAKINLALVVGPRREDGKHEIVTVYERIALADTFTLEPADRLEIEGLSSGHSRDAGADVSGRAAGVEPCWRVGIEKRIPVGAGLGGGSSDAAAALRLANASLAKPLDARRLHELAAALGADVPLFLTSGPQLGQGDGTRLDPARRFLATTQSSCSCRTGRRSTRRRRCTTRSTIETGRSASRSGVTSSSTGWAKSRR